MAVAIPLVEMIVVLVSLILVVAMAQLPDRGMFAPPHRSVVPLVIVFVVELVIQSTWSPSGLARVVIARRGGTGTLASRARPAPATTAAATLARLSLFPFLAGAGALVARIEGGRRTGKILSQFVEELRGAWLVVGGVVEVVVGRTFLAARCTTPGTRRTFARRSFARLTTTLTLATTAAPAAAAPPAWFVSCLARFFSRVSADFTRLIGTLIVAQVGTRVGWLPTTTPR